MSYIDRNLLPNEQLVYRTHLHWMLFIGPVVFSAAMIAAASILSTGRWSEYAWIPVALAAVLVVSALIRRQSSDFAVTNRRVMMKVGVFSARSIELLLNKIEAITVEQTLIGRIFGYGDVVVTGSGGTREVFSHIQSPLQFRRSVQSVAGGPTREG